MTETRVGSVYRYQGFGLTFESEIACPDFVPSDAPADAWIRFGSVPEHLEQPLVRGLAYEGEAGRILLDYPGTARLLVEAGREITVQPAPDVPEESVRVFLTGPALAALLLQRGACVLHAAACASARGAIVLAGSSGRGKSTLLAALLARGHRMLSDDILAVALDPAGHPIAYPAFSRLRLFPDSLGKTGLDRRDPRPVRPGSPKYSVAVAAEFHPEPRRILAVYLLDYQSAGGVQFQALTGQERLSAIRSHVYSRRLAEGLRLHTKSFPVVSALASRVPVVRVSRPRGLAFVETVVAELEAGPA